MAAKTWNITGMITPVRRAAAGITPEFYFEKMIDNSRLVRAVDPRRKKEIRIFSFAVLALFMATMFYAWQHFSALEYGYQIEAQKTERDRLLEANRALKVEEAGLRDPGRIDGLARQMGLEAPSPGQVVQLDTDVPGSTVMARVATVSVVSMQ